VHFVKVHDEHLLEMLTWERGVGPTLACGTGVCAAVAAANLIGLADRSVQVKCEGGLFEVLWSEATGRITLTGPAEEVFNGNIELDYLFKKRGESV
jgi:diaminopimelate epimerase